MTQRASLLSVFERVAQGAPAGSEAFVFAHLRLAELHVDRQPWRAAISARHVVRHAPQDDRGFAALGLCHAFLGQPYAALLAQELRASLEASDAYAMSPRRRTAPGRVVAALRRGLGSLPLDEEERRRALALARFATEHGLGSGASALPLAAAVAYRIARERGVPLSALDVASTYRVPTSSLRRELRALRAVL